MNRRNGRAAAPSWRCAVMVCGAWVAGCPPPVGGLTVADDHLYFCALYLDQELLEQAEARCELAREHDPSKPEVYNLQGLIARRRGQFDEATRLFKRAIALRQDFPEALNNYGELLLQDRRYADACELFGQALEAAPAYVSARANLAGCLYHVGDRERARREYLKCTEQDAARCDCRLGLGVLALESNELDRALEQFDRLVQLCPRAAGAHYNLCWIHLAREECAAAAAACGRALALDPGYLEAREARPRALACVARQEAALEELVAQVARHPTDVALRLALARMLDSYGLFDQAAVEYERVLRQDPTQLVVNYYAARLAERRLDAATTVERCVAFLRAASTTAYQLELAWCRERVRLLSGQ